MLSRLIYYSKSSKRMSLEDIREILKKSNQNNSVRGITGALYYTESYFIQVLEGGRKQVNEVFSKITGDDRHQNVVITNLSYIESRDFEKWSMLYLKSDKITETDILRHSSSTVLDPTNMTSDNILAFVLDLKDNQHY